MLEHETKILCTAFSGPAYYNGLDMEQIDIGSDVAFKEVRMR